MGLLQRLGPKKSKLAFFLAALASAVICLLAILVFLLGTRVMTLTLENWNPVFGEGVNAKAGQTYGWGMFCITPIVAAFLATVFLGDERMAKALLVSTLSVVIGCVMLLFVGFEGAICVLMAFPLIALQMLIGAAVGNFVLTRLKRRDPKAYFSFAILIPLALAWDMHSPPGPIHRTISTYVLINASPEKIWPLVSNLSNLPPPEFWLFKQGVAYPVTIKTFGNGVGASRLCRLSTGDMHEVVTVFEPNRKVVFKVLSTPDSMQESSPYGHIKTAHLHNNYESEYGEFELVPQPNGQTLLIGTSWYHYKMFPAIYWNLWTDTVVHHVQLMDMKEIKRRAESAG